MIDTTMLSTENNISYTQTIEMSTSSLCILEPPFL